ncbi:MAG TPA: hypothetical protein VHG91_03265 [Longimicrobium sp.]|nr:hypothetical protein [Longimicrobium sp.]
MRKIRLDIEDLAVESFDTAGQGENAGSVRGHDSYASEYSNCATCPEGCPRDTFTCFASCRYSGQDPWGPCQGYIDPMC